MEKQQVELLEMGYSLAACTSLVPVLEEFTSHAFVEHSLGAWLVPSVSPELFHLMFPNPTSQPY